MRTREYMVELILAAGFGLFGAASLAAGDCPLFPGAQYTVGYGPVFVASGDLNSDQVPDLAVANSQSDDLSVLVGAGDGSFAAAVYYAAGVGPYSVAIGDLDGDQRLDLAVTNSDDDSVTVLLGVGDGTFSTVVHYGAGQDACSVAIGDLDGDEVPDLALANVGEYPLYGAHVSVFLNQCHVACAGDANGDGAVDPLDAGFVLARFGCDVNGGDPNCAIADQNGDGVVDPLDVGFILARFGDCL